MTGTDFVDPLDDAEKLEQIVAQIDDSESVAATSHPDCDALLKLIDLDDWIFIRDAIRQQEMTIAAQANQIAEIADRDMRLLSLIYDIRKAAGDPEGKLMQEELVARIAALKAGNYAALAMVSMWRNRAADLLPARNAYSGGCLFAYSVSADELEQALGKGEK